MNRVFRRLHASMTVVSILASCLCHSQAETAREDARVFAHYMPWFRAEKDAQGGMIWDHWQWYGKGPKHDPEDILPNGHRDIASVYYPLIGPYDGRDASVIEYHMLTARAAGIDGFIADWYGPEEFTDRVFGLMTTAAERYGMKVAICLEEKTSFPPYSAAKTRAEAQGAMVRQLEYILAHYAASPAYLRRNGKPVLLVFNGYEEGILGLNSFSPQELAEVFARFKDRPFCYVRHGFDPRFTEVAQGCHIWNADGRPPQPIYEAVSAARNAGKVGYWLAGACPGFDDTGVWGWGRGPRVKPRRGTAEYLEAWTEAIARHPDAVQIITWNDFGEGTTIEPAEPYGFSFVDITEQCVQKFTGRHAYLPDNQWPHRIWQLRRKIGAMSDTPMQAELTRKLDEFVNAFVAGRHWLMSWRLKKLELEVAERTRLP